MFRFHLFKTIFRLFYGHMEVRLRYFRMFLTDGQKKKYKIMSRLACEKYCSQRHDKSSIIISIKSSWDRVDPDIYKNQHNNVRYIKFLTFDDIDMEDDPKCSMSVSDGRAVADFVNKHYDEVDSIIVHCDGGISRSAGVVAAIMRVKEGDDFPVFDSRRKHPNMTCYLMTLKGFGYI